MAGQFGLATESTWGTAVAVSKFFEPGAVNQTVDEGWLRPAGIRAGRRLQRPPKPGARTVTGQVRLDELPNTGGVATLLKHAFGSVVTTGSGPYTHTYSLGAPGSFTAQVGIEDEGGTVRPFTHEGCVLTQAEIGAAVGQFARITADWSAEDVVTGTALATASYASDLDPFTFVEGSLSLDGTILASTRSAMIRVGKALNTTRHRLGSRLIRRQREQGKWPITGTIECDFEDLDMVNAMVAATELDLELALDNGTDSLTITATIQMIGNFPSLTTNGLEAQTLNFEVNAAGADSAAFTAVLVNDESSAA